MKRRISPVVARCRALPVFGAGAIITVCLTVVPAFGQWLKYPTPGIPRTSDGKADLSAPVPRRADGKPDLSGLWQPDSGGYLINITADLMPGELMPWATALTKQRVQSLGRESPITLCLPPGPAVRAMAGLVKILQTPRSLVMLYENRIFDREVFMDGRALPDDPNPTWMGYSVGRWDGDTLVVESAGFNDKTWLDFAGHPHTERLRVTERLMRRDFGHMQVELTIDDPGAYARPFTVPVELQFMPDSELLEAVCNENERFAREGTTSTMAAITIPPNLLSTFVGTYTVSTAPQAGLPFTGRAFVVTLAGDQLMLQRPGAKVRAPLVPISDNRFIFVGAGAEVAFERDAQGKVTQLVLTAIEGQVRGIRTEN